jgi:hypothetical protein
MTVLSLDYWLDAPNGSVCPIIGGEKNNGIDINAVMNTA